MVGTSSLLLLPCTHNSMQETMLYPSLRKNRHRISVFISPHSRSQRILPLRGRVRVHLSLAAGHGDVYETAGVDDSLLRAALGGLLLLLGLDLWCLRLDLTGTRQ